MFSTRMFRLYVFLVLALLGLVLQAVLFNHDTIYTVATEVTEAGQVIETPKVVSISQHRKKMSDAPKVRVEEPVHDFGRLDPLTTGQHTFVIHNDGNAPLKLTAGATTCKCTVAMLDKGAIPAGGKTGVTMQWNTGRDPVYSHSATLHTNDPRQKFVRLKIEGRIQVLLQCQPKQLVFSRVEPGETPSASTIIYSQVWDDFLISDISPDLSELRCSVEETTREERAALDAKAARRLTVTLPDDLPQGYFNIPVKITARRERQQNNEQDTLAATDNLQAECELSIEGKRLRRLCVHGPHVDGRGVITLGRVWQGDGASIKLLLKVRDEQRKLRVRAIETIPASLNARIEPYEVEGSKDVGLYHLYLELPKDAPTFRLPPDKQGRIRIDFEHPRVTELDLPIDIVVAPRPEPRFRP